MKVIVLTAIGGDLAQNVARVIREFDSSIRLIGTDISERHGGKLFVDEYITVPPASDPTYAEVLKSLVREWKGDVVFPLSEQELAFFGGQEDVGFDWVGPGKKTLETGLDKWQTWKTLSDAGIAMPWTVISNDHDPQSLPCIVKERRTSGSRNVDIVRSNDDVEYYRNRYQDSIFQELLLPAEEEITCAIYRNSEGDTAVLQLRRKLDDGGVTAWAEVVRNEEINAMCLRVAKILELSGSANIQLRFTAHGPRIFEINPRLSSTVLMRHKLGFTDVVWTLQELRGEKTKYSEIKAGLQVVRTHDAEII